MKLEVGKKYSTREGEIVKITEWVAVGNGYEYFDSKGRSYTENGTYWQYEDLQVHKLNLIEEI